MVGRREKQLQRFRLLSTMLIGARASQELPAQVARLEARRVLLVTDRFFAQNGLAARFAHRT